MECSMNKAGKRIIGGVRRMLDKPARFVEPDADTLAKAHAVHAASCVSWLRWEQLGDECKAEFFERAINVD
jgi:hypothetical protein